MIFRFSLYGFLKNQQYYEPFLWLAFREKGLSFFEIGLLIAFREIWINLFEVPTGVVADLFGRRRCMVFSFVAYIFSFGIFGLAEEPYLLAQYVAAMFFFALGEAFRTGTHKAMIFDWLARQGRSAEKTEVYGLTRSWSKIGSAVCSLLAMGIVFGTGRYAAVFWFCIPPYLVNIVNLLSYPKELDGERKTVTLGQVAGLLGEALRQSVRKTGLRRLLFESMTFEGVFESTKDYVQPVMKASALSLGAALFVSWSGEQKTAVLVGLVSFVLHLLSSVAARRAGRFAKAVGGEEQAARTIWYLAFLVFAGMLPALYFGVYGVAIVMFVLLSLLYNLWRPVLVSRVNTHSAPEMAATVLSLEEQAKSLFTLLAAPAVGWTVDLLSTPEHKAFWPVAVLGLAVAGLMLLAYRRAVLPALVAEAGKPSPAAGRGENREGEEKPSA